MVRFIAILGDATSLRERNSGLVDRGVEGFHLELVIVLASLEALVVHVEGTVRQGKVVHFRVSGTDIIHKVIGPGIGS